MQRQPAPSERFRLYPGLRLIAYDGQLLRYARTRATLRSRNNTMPFGCSERDGLLALEDAVHRNHVGGGPVVRCDVQRPGMAVWEFFSGQCFADLANYRHRRGNHPHEPGHEPGLFFDFYDRDRAGSLPLFDPKHSLTAGLRRVQRQVRLWSARRWAARRLAVAMAFHARLGGAAPLAGLPADLLRTQPCLLAALAQYAAPP